MWQVPTIIHYLNSLSTGNQAFAPFPFLNFDEIKPVPEIKVQEPISSPKNYVLSDLQNDEKMVSSLRLTKVPSVEEAESESLFGAESEGEIDEHYKPAKQTQKPGRNIFSNIFRSFLRYLKSPVFLDEEMPKITEMHSITLSKKDFGKKLRVCTLRMKSYIKRKEMMSLFGINPRKKVQEAQFNLVVRVAVKHFLMNYHKTQTLISKKIGRQFKLSHLQGARNFEKFISNALKKRSNKK